MGSLTNVIRNIKSGMRGTEYVARIVRWQIHAKPYFKDLKIKWET
jgi:hypothetical protein